MLPTPSNHLEEGPPGPPAQRGVLVEEGFDQYGQFIRRADLSKDSHQRQTGSVISVSVSRNQLSCNEFPLGPA